VAKCNQLTPLPFKELKVVEEILTWLNQTDLSDERTMVTTDVDGSSHSDGLQTVVSVRQIDRRKREWKRGLYRGRSDHAWFLPLRRRSFPDAGAKWDSGCRLSLLCFLWTSVSADACLIQSGRYIQLVTNDRIHGAPPVCLSVCLTVWWSGRRTLFIVMIL